MDQSMESNDGQEMDQEWNQMFEMMERAEVSDFVVNANFKCESAPSGRLPRSRGTPNLINQFETVRKYESASSDRLGGSTATPNLINQSETVRNCGTTLGPRAFKHDTKSFYPSDNHMKHTGESHNQTEKKVYNSGFEESRAQESGFGVNRVVSCFRPSKDNTQSFYQSSNYANHVNINQNSGIGTRSLMPENNQRNHNAGTNFARGTSRSETYNCPSHTTMCNRAFKHTTQSYSYHTSSEDESELIERKERERYERKLIHLRQKS